jgi:hypothetical protein
MGDVFGDAVDVLGGIPLDAVSLSMVQAVSPIVARLLEMTLTLGQERSLRSRSEWSKCSLAAQATGHLKFQERLCQGRRI